MNNEGLRPIDEYYGIMQRYGYRSREAADFTRGHEDDPEFLELAAAAQELAAVRSRRLTRRWIGVTLFASLFTAFMVYLFVIKAEADKAGRFRDSITASLSYLSKGERLLFDRDRAVALLPLLRPVKTFAQCYPPDSYWWGGLWNEELSLAYVKYSFTEWQVDRFQDGAKREELDQRIAWFRRRYPEVGDVEVFEGRKLLSLPHGPSYSQAYAAFDKAIHEGTNDPAAWGNRGWCRLMLLEFKGQGDYVDALDDFRRALELSLARRAGNPHDVSFSTPLSNYRNTIALALATAAERGNLILAQKLGQGAVEVFARGTTELVKAVPDSHLPTYVTVDIICDSLYAVQQWLEILHALNRPASEFLEPNRLTTQVEDEIRRLVRPYLTTHEAAAIDARLELLRLTSGDPDGEDLGRSAARHAARCRAIEAYRSLVEEFAGRDRSKEETYAIEVKTLEAQQRWELIRERQTSNPLSFTNQGPSTRGLGR